MIFFAEHLGGPKEDRTPDLCIANAALSQLSYRPSRTSVALAEGPSLPVGFSRFHVGPSREILYVLFGRILRTRIQQPAPGARARGHL